MVITIFSLGNSQIIKYNSPIPRLQPPLKGCATLFKNYQPCYRKKLKRDDINNMSNRKDNHQIRRKLLLITKHDLYLDLLMEVEAVKEFVFAPADPISFFDARGNKISHPKRKFNMDW